MAAMLDNADDDGMRAVTGKEPEMLENPGGFFFLRRCMSMPFRV